MKERTRYWLARGGFESRWGDYAAAETAFGEARTRLKKDAGAGDELATLSDWCRHRCNRTRPRRPRPPQSS